MESSHVLTLKHEIEQQLLTQKQPFVLLQTTNKLCVFVL